MRFHSSTHEVVQKIRLPSFSRLSNHPATEELKRSRSYHDLATEGCNTQPKYVRRSLQEPNSDEAPSLPLHHSLTRQNNETGIDKKQNTELHILKPANSGAHEGTGVTPGVLDVPTYESDDEQISFGLNRDDEIHDAYVEGDKLNEERRVCRDEADMLYGETKAYSCDLVTLRSLLKVSIEVFRVIWLRFSTCSSPRRYSCTIAISTKLRDEAQVKNESPSKQNQHDDNIKKIIKGSSQQQVNGTSLQDFAAE
ncbi:hypothetical protein Tco_0317728 [Tanacetum coccineum]